MDCIHLSGIRCYGYTGALPEEQVLGQWFEVGLTLWLDLALAGQSDRLSDTLDYRIVIATVQALVKTSKFTLLERLAVAIAEAVLHSAALTAAVPVQQVQVRLCKPAAPIPDFGGAITVEVTRSR
ncbi:dihydroneopterin aldolase [Stenomitos frigidus]|uniref:7,8-dihydroneopterin aldolase n=1 Tax=Stenomitos frigidus ULC18 TaxID=2107698 RepID=A0A2T1ENP9_9CYAN|nr:dihydroneopterin aldolase [Stenomitos frigidus]PSB34364.1 dihydroneopterin aldolase [Stenomitos frigidus ULC18]